jgi:ribosomal protein S18 acetylase RimI-like enzyme
MFKDLDKKTFDEINELVVETFGIDVDPEQLPPTPEVWQKLLEMNKNSIVVKRTDDGELIGSVCVVPTNEELMQKFIDAEITEKQLFEMTPLQKNYETIYVCAAIIKPEYRKQGWATKMLTESIVGVENGKEAQLFCWTVSPEGEKLVSALERKLDRKIIDRSKSA